MEWKLPAASLPVWSRQFHQDRERARHLEDPGHRPRLLKAAELALSVATPELTLSDLGCGDGGFLQLVHGMFRAAWGYDFCPANAEAWDERHVTGTELDVFGTDREMVQLGDVIVMTEVLEHLADPHGALAWVRGRGEYLVCSSPFAETDRSYAPEHAWAWDTDGYKQMIVQAGWRDVIEHQLVGASQVVLAR